MGYFSRLLQKCSRGFSLPFSGDVYHTLSLAMMAFSFGSLAFAGQRLIVDRYLKSPAAAVLFRTSNYQDFSSQLSKREEKAKGIDGKVYIPIYQLNPMT